MITTLVALAALGASSTPPLRPIYDERRRPSSAAPTSAEAAVLEAGVRKQAAAHWGESESCEDEFKVVGAASGSFTTPRSSQRAFLYTFCVTGHGFASNGLAVFERERLVLHLAYNGGWDNTLVAVPDLDGNGLDELLISAGDTHQGQTTSHVYFVELDPKRPRSLGSLGIYEDDCGMEGGEQAATAYALYVRPGPKPAFHQEEFRSRCGDGSWTRVGGPAPVSLQPFDWPYERLK